MAWASCPLASRTLMDSNGEAVHTNRLKVCSAGEVGENLCQSGDLAQRLKRLYTV